MTQQGKALVLCSGGLDSTVLLARYVERLGAASVYALSISYGQRHQREVEAARATGAYAEQQVAAGGGPVSTYVPFRNGLFLSAAASMALSLECSVVGYGAHHDDWAGAAYPDCSAEFVGAMARAVSEGTGGQLSLEAPFVAWSKADIVAEGLRLGVPFELTWSCYEGGEAPCGRCATCLDRAAAFAAHGVADPALAA